MPFIPNRIEAVCGAHIDFMSQDPMVTVKTELGGKGAMCAGCTFTINHETGRVTLTNTDKYRECLEDKAPIADKTSASE
ncbi:MAG: hypothetical protein US68_C0010G0089 [Candidatus Shapirobacteria bacterium GW2011_GWE1_38_10]|uniref:Uncharacterized protein n=1 Tax=Candidatus Shapirobacteria bacterium GW2011_GWE1_38_10 TaxID=1618488 RepID=A0A0G0IG15_9BACT|nr:MAG: hypothetical protein US46_C0013G0044 [Candidatus Shapirobacteria bacterium GW2011_GWF2_37_20]KKQ49955.1 MAG: hypothetical protein US68_C0010G0089 [Candidatus Shapirobacteria bacterium GW2011_GWE1_38_10]KKQ62750.1 MAG: hypothetical protein US85_C0022G0005 [Candidatus Shapirobacteria bacterium GW2011_GWF1_38_23]HBP51503.1 hypothetical protein [Candidatus Shapirobacteria bacterium]